METLPPEIITKILEYLPFGDRRVVAMVNKAFYYASYHPAFSRKEFLTYQTSGVDLKKFTDFKKMLKKSRRKLFCLKFVDFIFIDDLTIFTNLGNHIISLHFNNLKCLNDSFLDAISQCCRNLEKLELVRLQDLSITDKNRAPIYKLCSITLDDVQMSDREFNPILKFAPNLKDLSIVNCNINGSSQVLKRFYPQRTDSATKLITLKILGSRISHLSLRHIWNSTLKVITFDSVSLLPFRVEENLLAVRQTILLLGIRIPLLTQLEIYIDSPSFSVIEDQNLLSYYWEDIKELVKRCFKEMKIFRLWK